MSQISYLTEEGLRKLKDELDRLKTIERRAISKQIAEARDKGDLSENAEYDAAKDAQGMLEMKISKLEEALSTARIIDETKLDNSKIQIFSKVKLLNNKDKTTTEYTIVSESESNVKERKLSIKTPIASCLLGKKVGDQVEVKVPSGTMSFEIIEISR